MMLEIVSSGFISEMVKCRYDVGDGLFRFYVRNGSV